MCKSILFKSCKGNLNKDLKGRGEKQVSIKLVVDSK